MPPSAEPPTHLNLELMARYRPLIEKHRYDPDSRRTYLEQLGVAYPPAPQ